MKLIRSRDSRYFLEVSGRFLRLYRNDHYRAIDEIWHREMTDESIEILGLATTGILYMRSALGPFIVPVAHGKNIEPIRPLLASELGERRIHKIRVSPDGHHLALECSAPMRQTRDMLAGLFSPSREEPSSFLHRIIIYSMADGRQEVVCEVPVSAAFQKLFKWDVSSDFRYLAVTTPGREGKGTAPPELVLIRVESKEILNRFPMALERARDLRVGEDSLVLLDVPSESEPMVYLMGRDSRMRITPPSREYVIYHFGRKCLAFWSGTKGLLTVKSFDNLVLCRADLAALDRMQVEYAVSFTDRDEVDFIYRREGRLKAMHLYTDTFDLEVRRWKYMLEQQQARPAVVPAPAESSRPRPGEKISLD
jgi:hypothetical protein